MKKILLKTGEENMYSLLIVSILTGIIYAYSRGISGNDFWWHVKAGEWIVTHKSIPYIDVFSWFAKENNLIWISHEWLSEVFFYTIHNLTGELGIFILSLLSAIIMATMIIVKNEKGIKSNFIVSFLFFFPSISLFRSFFYARPHLLTFFLLYMTLYILYTYRKNKNNKLIYLIPIIAILWSNLHGGSSNLIYILCFIFALSGVVEFSAGKLIGDRLGKEQILTYLGAGLLSILVLAVNPHGITIITYPFVNIGDTFMQSTIAEWSSPDAKELYQLIQIFMPFLTVGITLIITEKKIKFVDLLIFLFFTYLLLRSVRFSMLFYISSTFYLFDYVIPRKVTPLKSTNYQRLHYALILMILCVNFYSLFQIGEITKKNTLITVALEKEFVELIKKESPQRLFNDYNYGETLIYHDIETFVDARADIFTSHNLRDSMGLKTLMNADKIDNNKIFDPELIIDKYKFDAFVIQSNRSLAAYLISRPEEYDVLLQTENTIYFKKVNRY